MLGVPTVAVTCEQGIRPALASDLSALKQLLEPLERAGITKARSREQVAAAIPHFTVVERERKARIAIKQSAMLLALLFVLRDLILSCVLHPKSCRFQIGAWIPQALCNCLHALSDRHSAAE